MKYYKTIVAVMGAIVIVLCVIYFTGGDSGSDNQDMISLDDDSHTHDAKSDNSHTAETNGDGHDHSDLLSVEGDWLEQVGLKTIEVQKMSIERVVTVPGTITPNQNQVAVISPFIDASVNCVFKNIGDRVEKDDELACLSSPEIGMLRADYDKAKAEIEIQKQNHDRVSKLFTENIVSKKSFQQSELDLNLAEVNYNFSLKRLLSVGLTKKELDHPPTGHSEAVGSTIHLHAPIAGVITHRDASIGQKVNSSHRLFEIINLSTVWCEADLFEKDLNRIEIGQTVKIRVFAFPELRLSGKIFYIGSTLNPNTKTVKILVEIENKSEKLKPGMFADTHIIVGEKSDALVIPREAVLEDEHLQVVFVKEAEGFHRHIVTTGISTDSDIEIESGLQEGDVIVTTGNYQLKSKLKMGTIDPHAGHAH